MRGFLLAMAAGVAAGVAGAVIYQFAGPLLVNSDSSPPSAASDELYGNFFDGDFEEAGEIVKELEELQEQSPTGDPLLDSISDSLGASGRRPIGKQTKGDVKLVFDGGNTLLELAATPQASAEITEFVLFHHRNVVVEFDLWVLDANPGAVFEVVVAEGTGGTSGAKKLGEGLYPDTVVASYDLPGLKARNHMTVTGMKDYFAPARHASSALEAASIVFRLRTARQAGARVRLDNLNVITLDELPTVSGLSALSGLAARVPTLENMQDLADDPEVAKGRVESFMTELQAVYDGIVEKIGPPPEPIDTTESVEIADPRAERVSRGFFQEMKAYLGGGDTEDVESVDQEERLRGMSQRIDHQFQDVSALLKEFEDEQHGGP